MREILFRAKRTDNGEWIFGDLWHNNSETMIIDQPATIEYDVIPETVGQYTGLTDKNGKKVFEGDILKNEYKKNKYQYFKVFYCSLTYCWLVENKYGMLGKLYNVIGNIEIIGNIHDNPKLLKGGEE